MTVAKVIEVSSSSSKGLEDAVQTGIKKASGTVKDIKGAWIKEIKVVTDDKGTITEWRTDMKVTFVVG